LTRRWNISEYLVDTSREDMIPDDSRDSTAAPSHASATEATGDRVLAVDSLLWVVGVVICISMSVSHAPWLLPVGSVALVIIAVILLVHRRRRHAEIKRLRAAKIARRQERAARRS
jgi:Na+/H+ antiporter NhaD/arsenite permease-like protein